MCKRWLLLSGTVSGAMFIENNLAISIKFKLFPFYLAISLEVCLIGSCVFVYIFQRLYVMLLKISENYQ